MAEPDIEIRSHNAVFALERRIYRIDTLRLNPGGIPLRGIAYSLVCIVAFLMAGTLPVVSWLLDAVPWYFRDIALPLGSACLLAVLRIDGRPFHLAALAAVRYSSRSRRFVALSPRPRLRRRWSPPPIVWIADGSEARPRAFRYRGPGAVLVHYPHDRVEWGHSHGYWRPDVSLHPAHGSWKPVSAALELGPGAVLEVSRRPLTADGPGSC
ncbi:MAG: hypothetical protein ABSG64_12570 [Solirubrobacteraceae bacterium]|jgi:hypothetical protein